MSPENVTSMLVLASSLKWRLPVNDKEFDTAVTANPYAKLPFEINLKNEDGTDHTILPEFF
jgi:hypothetical protein